MRSPRSLTAWKPSSSCWSRPALAIAAIIGGLFRAHPAVALDHHLGASTEAGGVLLVLKAFASGCSALTESRRSRTRCRLRYRLEQIVPGPEMAMVLLRPRQGPAGARLSRGY